MYFATGDEPTKEIAFTFGWVSSASTHSRPPWTRLSTPLGKPAFSSSSMIITTVSGTFSLGFSTKVFPQAIASGNIHIGTIAGKLNGVIPTQTPSGWSSVSQSTLAREILERVAHEQRRHPAGVFDVLDPAINAAARFGQRLAMLSGDALANAIEVFLDQLPVTKENPRPFHRRCFAPGGEGRRRRLDGFVHNFGAAHRHLRDDFAARWIEDGRSSDTGKMAPFAVDEDGTGNHG